MEKSGVSSSFLEKSGVGEIRCQFIILEIRCQFIILARVSKSCVDLRLGHRAPGKGGRRASIPLHALTTLLSALGVFCMGEFRVFSTNLNILRSIPSAMETRLGTGSDGGPDGSLR